MPEITDEVAQLLRQTVRNLREGAVQAADDLVSSYLREATTPGGAAAPAAPAPPEVPREPETVIIDITRWLSHRFGNHPALEALIAELEKAWPRQRRQ